MVSYSISDNVLVRIFGKKTWACQSRGGIKTSAVTSNYTNLLYCLVRICLCFHLAVRDVRDICTASAREVTDRHGYLASPGYPGKRLDLVYETCSTTVIVPDNWIIRFYILDVAQHPETSRGCLLTLVFRQLLPQRRTGLFPQVSLCVDRGYHNNQLLLQSQSNIVQVVYHGHGHPSHTRSKKSGFLLYYQGRYQYIYTWV